MIRLLPLAFLVLTGTCLEAPAQLEDQTCPPEGTQLRYTTFAQPYFARNCDGCHTTSTSGAPTGYRFDTLEGIRMHAERIFARAAGPNVSMPPGPVDPPAEEREQLAEWLAAFSSGQVRQRRGRGVARSVLARRGCAYVRPTWPS